MDNSLVEQIKQVISGLTAPDGDLFFKCNSAETGGPQRVFCFCDLCKSKRRRSRRQIDVHRAVFVDCCHQQAHHVPAFVRGKPSSVRIHPAGLEHARGLGNGTVWVTDMPQPESAGRCVKTCVFESEFLRITNFKLCNWYACPRDFDHWFGKIYARHLGSALRSGFGQIPCPTTDVNQATPGDIPKTLK